MLQWGFGSADALEKPAVLNPFHMMRCTEDLTAETAGATRPV